MDTLKGTPAKKLGDFETDSEIQFLENLFNEECKCESKHIETTSAICSVKATHRADIKCLNSTPLLICGELALADFIHMNKGFLCGECNSRASDCWIITPI
jgi:hypothetical protein